VERLKIEGGIVVSMDPAIGDLRRGDVLIEDGAIVEVAPVIEAGDAEVIDASNLVVMPGLVDPHRHLWYAAQRAICYDGVLKTFEEVFWPKVGQVVEPPDVYDCTRAAVADALNSGVTSVLDFCHVINSEEHAEQAVQAHLDSDMRVVFGFGPSMKRKLDEIAGIDTGFSDWAQARRMQTEIFAGNDRLTLALAISGPELGTVEEAESDVALARANGLPVTTHLGLPQGLPSGEGVRRLAEKIELGPDIQFVHCSTTDAEEFGMIAAAGATAAFSPQCEVSIGMGIPPTGRAKAAGVPPAFGCDSITGSNGDQFDEARIGLMIERVLGAQDRYADARPVTDPAQLGITSREALEAVTINAARSMWLGDQVGSLTPGKRADITMLRMDDHNLAPLSNVIETIVCSANAGNVDTVLVDGKVVKRDGILVTNDAEAVVTNLEACRDRLFERGGYEGWTPARGAS
jgi:cytosine/adenosine deaminase-related metal-dependent hydrolase